MERLRGPAVSPDEFRAAGHAAVEWVARYLESLEHAQPVLSGAEPGALRAALPARPPEAGEPFDAILADLDPLILPGITHWQSPHFFAYFPANASPPAILGELISAGLGVQGMLWATSPACTELETHMMDWLVHALGLPARFLSDGPGGGVIQDTASSATLCALLAARERAARAGIALADMRVYASTQAHSSLAKGARIAGLADEQLRLVGVDAVQAMRADALAAAMASDVAAGARPVMVCATVGTTSTGAIDPVPAIADVAGAHGAWLHVDGAWAGAAAVCEEHRHLHAGLERADSYCFNPHKWLLTNFDCDAFWVADRGDLLRALSILPEYLRNRATESGAVIDYRDWQVPLGRRFRALKLWFVLRTYGMEGLRAHIRGHVALAEELAARVEAHPELVLVVPRSLSLVVFRHRAGDAATQAMLDTLNDSGALHLTHTRVGEDQVLALRMAIGARLTEAAHVHAAWERIRVAAG